MLLFQVTLAHQILLCILLQETSELTNYDDSKFDLEQNDSKVTGVHDDSRQKKSGPFSAVGPFRHRSMHSFFSRASSVGPVVDRVVSIVAYRHGTSDADSALSKVKVKEKANAKVTKESDRKKSTTDGRSTVLLR